LIIISNLVRWKNY